MQNYKGLWALAAIGIRDAYHGRLGYGGMPVEEVLHIRGVDVETGTDDQLLFSTQYFKVPLFIHQAQVSCIQPAIPQDTLCLFRPVPVSLHHGGALNDDFTFLVDG